MIKQEVGKMVRKVLPEDMYREIRQVMLSPKYNRRFHRIKNEKIKYNQFVVIGDSHSRFFSGATPDTEITIHLDENGNINYDLGYDKRFCAFDLGPALAFNLNKKGSTVRALEKYKWLSSNLLGGGDCLICAFGEIDIRAHVFRHVTEKVSYRDVVDKICDNYREFLHIIEKDGYYPIVWGPIASQKEKWRAYVQNQAIGTEQDRNRAVEYFNLRMKKECNDNGWGFLSIYNSLIDENYMTREEYIYDRCHLGENAKVLFEPEFQKWEAGRK